ncbi:MAG: glycosyl hydrolase family 28 protein [Bacteroidota bacterium]
MRFILLFLSYLFAISAFSQTYDITQYGAEGDGKMLNTSQIQNTIDICHQKGGGTILVPAGTFLTGTLRFYSNQNLHLSPGAILLGSTNLADYDTVHDQLIWGDSLENFSITGTGTINGQGETFFQKGTPTNPDKWTAKARPEPWILFTNSRRIQVKEAQFVNSPAHVLVFIYCNELFVDNISIRNDMRSPNTDGIDLKACQDVMISNTFMETGDDAICIKARQGDVSNVVVTNCILASDDAAIKFGTGSKYRIRNCQFSNINIRDTRFGIALFMGQGGTYENSLFQNIIIETSSRRNIEYPIFVDIDKRTPEYPLGKIHNITFKDMQITTRGQILIGGQADANIRDIRLENIALRLTGVTDHTKVEKKPRGNKNFKKISGMVDFSGKPAHLVFANVAGLTLHNIEVTPQFESSSIRWDNFLFHQVKKVDIGRIKATTNLETGFRASMEGTY